ncbi:MAG: bifunctional metallophosphatase/5'-nucleotidase [Eubacterium sp.]|nr:bifunctional metallophosphatase/5'-nucleotidase [Eubacterium sp.]
MKKSIFKRTIPTLALAATMMVSNVGMNSVIAADVAVMGEPDQRSIKTAEDNAEDYGGFEGKIIILQTNDSHGNIEDFKYVKSLENYFTSKGAVVLTVDCGDYTQCKKDKSNEIDYVEESEGISALKVMEAAGYDVIALGNHEFDYPYKDKTGRNLLQERLNTVKIDALCANIVEQKDKEAELLINHNCVKTVKVPDTDQSVNIGFFGVDTGETKEHGKKEYVADLTVYTNNDLVKCAKREIDDLRNTGDELDETPNATADIVICLAHLGVNTDRMGKDSSILLYNGIKDKVDLILDGNSHTVMTSGNDGERIMSTGIKLANIGVVVIDPKKDNKPSIIDRFLIPNKYFRELEEDKDTVKVIKAAKNKEFDSLDPNYEGKKESSSQKNNKVTNRNGKNNNGNKGKSNKRR